MISHNVEFYKAKAKQVRFQKTSCIYAPIKCHIKIKKSQSETLKLLFTFH